MRRDYIWGFPGKFGGCKLLQAYVSFFELSERLLSETTTVFSHIDMNAKWKENYAYRGDRIG